jgi:hypothetical protein
VRPHLENYPTHNRAGEVPQEVKCLSNKCETLSSNSSTATKKIKKKSEEEGAMVLTCSSKFTC